MMMGREQTERLMSLLSKLNARDSGDHIAADEVDRRRKSFNMPEFGGQEHNDTKTLEHLGWVKSPGHWSSVSNTWSPEGIYAFALTEDGRAALANWRTSSTYGDQTTGNQINHGQHTRPRVMLVHGSKDGHIPPIVDHIRLWCFDHGLDARKAADYPNSGRFVHQKVDAVINESDYYIVVLTADEELTNGTFRSRPNPMIEMGRLMATNPEKVCILKEAKVEMPSDYAGLVTESLENWESVLVRELKNAGML